MLWALTPLALLLAVLVAWYGVTTYRQARVRAIKRQLRREREALTRISKKGK